MVSHSSIELGGQSAAPSIHVIYIFVYISTGGMWEHEFPSCDGKVPKFIKGWATACGKQSSSSSIEHYLQELNKDQTSRRLTSRATA